MGSSCILGIDCGTSVIKAAAFTTEGTELATATAEGGAVAAGAGRSEYDPAGLWNAAASAIRALVETKGIAAADVQAVVPTGAGNGVLLLDAQQQPLGNGIVALDQRAAAEADPERDPAFTAAYRALSGQGLWTGQTATLLRHLAAADPARWQACRRYVGIKDWIKLQLCGAFVSDPGEQGKNGLLDLGTGTASSALCACLGLPELADRLPALAPATAVVGTISSEAAQACGLRAGTPVVNGLADIDASALGAGAARAGQLSVVAGTWSINQLFMAEPVAENDCFGCSPHAVPGVYELLEASPCSVANFNWFVDHCCDDLKQRLGGGVYAECDRLVAALPPASTPICFLPFLFGSNAGPCASAGFLGLSGWQDRAQMLAALYEGVVYSHRAHIDQLLQWGHGISEVRLAGGAARSAVWTQIFADVLGKPVITSHAREVGALGAAICGAVAIGAHDDIAAAAAAMVQAAAPVHPVAERVPRYQTRYEHYRRICQHMAPVWHDLRAGFAGEEH